MAKDKLKEKLKVNLGCGVAVIPGWINVDSSPNALLAKLPGYCFIKSILFKLHLISDGAYNAKWSKDIVYCNLEKSFLSIAKSSCCTIYTSHFLEHIPKAAAISLLKECYAALCSGGILRVAVPNLYSEAKKYVECFETTKENGSVDYNASEDFIHLMVSRSQRHSHRWMYDYFSLSHLLREIGYVEVNQKEFLQSEIEEIRLLETREDSLFIECKKPWVSQ